MTLLQIAESLGEKPEELPEVPAEPKPKGPSVDKWCAAHIRRVRACSDCLHYRECLALGHSVAPSAKARRDSEELKKLGLIGD